MCETCVGRWGGTKTGALTLRSAPHEPRAVPRVTALSNSSRWLFASSGAPSELQVYLTHHKVAVVLDGSDCLA